MKWPSILAGPDDFILVTLHPRDFYGSRLYMVRPTCISG